MGPLAVGVVPVTAGVRDTGGVDITAPVFDPRGKLRGGAEANGAMRKTTHARVGTALAVAEKGAVAV
jgi:hypothetical protein